MKKIVVSSIAVLFCACFTSVAFAECSVDKATKFRAGNNQWNADSNEYLFPTEDDYFAAVNHGYVYECDNDGPCANDTWVKVTNGVKEGQKVTGYFLCIAPTGVGDDRFKSVSAADVAGKTECTTPREDTGWWGPIPTNAEANEYLYPSQKDYDAVKGLLYGNVLECGHQCGSGESVSISTVHYFTGNKISSKLPRTYKCVDGEQWIDITDDKNCPTCKSGDSNTPAPDKKPEPDKKPNPQPKPKGKTCEELYPNGSKERLACCHAGNTTKWENEQCICVDSTLVWNGAKCIQKSEETDCVYKFVGSVVCSNGGRMDANTMIKLTKDDLNGNSCNDFLSLLERDKSKVMALADKYCQAPAADPQPVPQPKVDVDKIKNAREKLSAFFKKVDSDRSVWKNADGSFNGARLASDLTAGVVLGTVGGVVSGVLIKKSQVEKGFDALNCTVNGQKIADWGDEFTVGLRR